VVGHAFNTSETISSLTIVLKEAFLGYGIPKRLYVDNGPSFSSELLVRSCAMAGISLTHSKPYDSPSRGKIERFFRTVRDRFLSGVQEGISLEELNEAFWLWLQEDYHHKLHTGIGQRPVDRYNASVDKVPIRRLSKAELDEIFLIRYERVVNNDATISFNPAFSGTMRYPRPISDTESRSDIQSTTPKTFISMTVMCGWEESNWWIKRKTPVPSGPRRSTPIYPFTKGGFSHEGSTGLVRTQTLPF
jgi:hypothetical protein